jgi:hypothetical protein
MQHGVFSESPHLMAFHAVSGGIYNATLDFSPLKAGG